MSPRCLQRTDSLLLLSPPAAGHRPAPPDTGCDQIAEKNWASRDFCRHIKILHYWSATKGFLIIAVATGRRAPPSAAGHRVRPERGKNWASQNSFVVATTRFFTTACPLLNTVVATGRRGSAQHSRAPGTDITQHSEGRAGGGGRKEKHKQRCVLALQTIVVGGGAGGRGPSERKNTKRGTI